MKRFSDLLILTTMLLVYAFSKNEPKDLEWWETTIFYQIYTRSFKDSDGDGIGDIKGITVCLQYLKELGIGAVLLAPIFKSSMYDTGYDISDFYDIHHEYGLMDDFEELLTKAKELDIKVVLSLVPNHASNESKWFRKALRGHEKFFNYFVWEDGIVDIYGNLQPPNNWLSVFRESAWEYRSEVSKFYLHQFVVGAPDLNYNNPEVVDEIKNIMRFWLQKGVAGFKLDGVAHLFEVDKAYTQGKYPDEPLSGNFLWDTDHYEYLDHVYTRDLEKSYDMVYQWREVFDEIAVEDGLPRVMITEAYSTPHNIAKYFGDGKREGAQLPLNLALITNFNNESTAADLKYALDVFMTYKPINSLANWVAGNHDNSRVASRLNLEIVDAINMIILLSPGVAITYMGEEIGMEDGVISWEETVDPAGCNTNDPNNYHVVSRDPARTPFQWSARSSAGFSKSAKTWLPLAHGYETLNVEAQKRNSKSHLNIYKMLAKLRTRDLFKFGRYESLALNQDVFAFKRWYGTEFAIVVMNFGSQESYVDLTYFESIPEQLQVELTNEHSDKEIGHTVSSSALFLYPYEAILLEDVSF